MSCTTSRRSQPPPPGPARTALPRTGPDPATDPTAGSPTGRSQTTPATRPMRPRRRAPHAVGAAWIVVVAARRTAAGPVHVERPRRPIVEIRPIVRHLARTAAAATTAAPTAAPNPSRRAGRGARRGVGHRTEPGLHPQR